MFQNAVLVWVPKYRKLGRYVAHIGPTKMGGDTKGAVRQERKLCGGGPVAPRRCSCGRRCQRAWASRCCSGGQGPRAAALAWLEGQARRGFSLKPAHGARVKARRPHAWWARARRRQASSGGCRRSQLLRSYHRRGSTRKGEGVETKFTAVC